MTRHDVQQRPTNHPVEIALKDSDARARLVRAGIAFLGRRAQDLSPTERAAEAGVIVQEAARRAWKRRADFDPSKDAVNWLVGFVINVAREDCKKRARDKARLAPENATLDTLAVDGARPVDDAVADKLLVDEILENLPSTDRRIVEMKYFDDMTCAEIGRRLGMTENCARVRLYRAVQKLKRSYGAPGEGRP